MSLLRKNGFVASSVLNFIQMSEFILNFKCYNYIINLTMKIKNQNKNLINFFLTNFKIIYSI